MVFLSVGVIDSGHFKGKADINGVDADGETALLISLLNMHFDFASALVAAGSNARLLGARVAANKITCAIAIGEGS